MKKTAKEALGECCLSFPLAWGVPISIGYPVYGPIASIFCFYVGKTLIERTHEEARLAAQAIADQTQTPTTLSAYSMSLNPPPPVYTPSPSRPAFFPRSAS